MAVKASFTITLARVDDGAQGIAGKAGADGKTPYFHTAWADSANGATGFVTSYPTSGTKAYMGTYSDFTSADSTSYKSYTWARVLGNTGATGPQGQKGDTGATGTPGKPGADGKTPYVHYAYADSADGKTNFTVTYPTTGSRAYVGILTDYTSADSTDYTKYTWAKFVGPQGNTGANGIAGKDGTGIKSTTITYASSTSGTTAPTSGWVSTPPSTTPGQFIWTRTIWTYTDGTTETGYSVGHIGADGSDGLPGKAGADGRTPYFHQAWADSSDGKTNFSTTVSLGKKYLGTYTDYVVADSTDPKKYKWTELVGAIEIGGRNLLRNSDFNPIRAPWAYAASSVTMEGNAENPVDVPANNKTILIRSKVDLVGNGSSDHGNGLNYSAPFVKAGTTYTFSAFVRGSGSETTSKWVAESNGTHFYFDIKPGEWQRVSGQVTFQTDKRTLYIYQATVGTPKLLCISSPKLEIGNKATDWSPAPEDNASASDLAKTNQTVDTVVTQTAKNWSVFAQKNGIMTGISVDANGVIDMNAAKVTIPGTLIVGGTIPATALKNGSITNTQLADNSVGSSKIANGAITSGKIANGAIANINLADNSVSTAKIAGGAITASQIGKDAITSVQIKDGAVTAGAIAAGAVGASAIAANAVSANNIAAGAISADKIRADAIDGKTIKGSTIVSSFNRVQPNGATFTVHGDLTLENGALSTTAYRDSNNSLYSTTNVSPVDIGSVLYDSGNKFDEIRLREGQLYLGGLYKETASSNAVWKDGIITPMQLLMMQRCGLALWSGAAYMHGTQTVTPSFKLNECLNGWLLEWQLYVGGAANNTDIMQTPIFKSVVNAHNGKGFSLNIGIYQDKPVRKYLFPTITSIKGADLNNTGVSHNFVLTAVYAF